MIVQEQIDNLIFTHSDSGYYIIQNETGLEYMDAVDMIPCEYTYRESENKIPREEDADVPI